MGIVGSFDLQLYELIRHKRSQQQVAYTQTANDAYGLVGRLTVASAVNMTAGYHAGLYGNWKQKGATTLNASTISWNGGVLSVSDFAGACTLANGVRYGGVAVMIKGAGSLTENSTTGRAAGVLIGKNTADSLKWPRGIHIEGDAVDLGISMSTVTGTGIDIEGSTTGIDIGTCSTGITFTGAVANGINFSGATVAMGSTKSILNYGIIGTPVSVSMTDTFAPIQVVVMSHANPSGTKVMELYYCDLETDASQANARLRAMELVVGINNQVKDSAVLRCGLNQTGTGAAEKLQGHTTSLQLGGAATIGEGHALYASLWGSAAWTCSELTVAKFVQSASGTVSKAIVEVSCAAYCSTTHGIEFTGEGTITAGISFEQVPSMTDGIDFSGVNPVYGSGNAIMFKYGKRGTPKSVSITDWFEPMQIVVTSHANPGATTIAEMLYINLATDASQANMRLRCIETVLDIANQTKNSATARFGTNQTGNGASDKMQGITTSIQLGGTATIGETQALYASLYGAGAITSSEATVAKIVQAWTGAKAKAIIEVNNAAYCSTESGIRFDGDGAWDSIFDFIGLGDGTVVLEDNLEAGTKAGSIKIIMPSGGVAYINVYDGGRS